MKLLILEIDEPVGIHRFKIGDKVQIKSEMMNIHFDYVKVRGIVDLNVWNKRYYVIFNNTTITISRVWFKCLKQKDTM